MRSYFSSKRGNLSTRDRTHRRLYSCAFHEKFLVQYVDELFDGKFEGGIGRHNGSVEPLEARHVKSAKR